MVNMWGLYQGPVSGTCPHSPDSGKLSLLGRAHEFRLASLGISEYVAEAEKRGTENFPIYRWTKVIIEDPVKKEIHARSFSVHVDGNEVYEKEIADALESNLHSLLGGALVTRLSRHDTNPANNLPIP